MHGLLIVPPLENTLVRCSKPPMLVLTRMFQPIIDLPTNEAAASAAWIVNGPTFVRPIEASVIVVPSSTIETPTAAVA